MAACRSEPPAAILSYYWGGAMVGRFVGALAMVATCSRAGCSRSTPPPRSSCCSSPSRAPARGHVERARDRALQLDHVPDDLRARARRPRPRTRGKARALLCMAIVGGAIVPVIQGYFADHVGILHVVPGARRVLPLHRVLRALRTPPRARVSQKKGAGPFGRALYKQKPSGGKFAPILAGKYPRGLAACL